MDIDAFYYQRELSQSEELFVSRAWQRIAVLGKELSDEIDDNDVTFLKGELILELQYAINALRSTFLDWSEDEIQGVINYYTVRADLSVFGYRELNFNKICALSGETWATVGQLMELREESESADRYLQEQINYLLECCEEVRQAIEDISGGVSGGGSTTRDLTAGLNVGGIKTGTVFPEGTEFTDMWEALFSALSTINTLRYNGYVSTVEVGASKVLTLFTWNSGGSPTALKLSDDDGQLSAVAVTGNSYAPPVDLTYNWDTQKTIKWTLSSSNAGSTTVSTTSYYRAYWGKKILASDTVPFTVTENDILNDNSGSKVAATSSQIEFNINTSTTEQAWIAVEQAQSGSDYTNWYESSANLGPIQAGLNFIQPPYSVIVNGRTYRVYTYGYRSPFNSNLRLHK